MRFSGAGIQMVLVMMICWWFGERIELKGWVNPPWGQLIGIMFGVFASIYHLIKSVSKF
ncbi:MAG: AtpZ/AtpI family protein [Candidatus Marinimicrobia bacterium]|nr:AtpZ/AtpI family protein [Candidatus Neomarinimicrobiota bacterium]